MKAQSAVRTLGRVVASEQPAPVWAPVPPLLDLQRTAGNAAVAALLQGADARTQAVLSGSSSSGIADALAGTFGDNARDVPIEAESPAAGRAEAVTVHGRVHLGPGRFDPTDHEGKVRIGHEVAHALQQARGTTTTTSGSPVPRATLEAEAERAGHAFAGGRAFAVSGAAPPGTPLFRGADEPQPEAEQELDAAIAQLNAEWAAQSADLAAARKQKQDWLRAHAEWHEYDVPVDERLRKTPASLQPHELDIRLLETVIGSISREDAEYVLRRMGWRSRSVEEASVHEQIRTRPKIYYRTRDISLAVEYYNQLIEDRRRRLAYVEELFHTGPDMALEMFKDVGRGYYNGALGFVQGAVDLPLAPRNLVRAIRGEEPVHLLDLGGLRAGYHTSYGFDQGSSIELGTQLPLMALTAKLPSFAPASRAGGLLSTLWKANALAAGGTAMVQAGQAVRDIARGYVVENGKQRPLTEDDIIQRLGSIAFGAHVAYHALGGRPGNSGRTAEAEPPAPMGEPPKSVASPPSEVVEPPKAAATAGPGADVSPLEIPGEVVVVEGRAPDSPTAHNPQPPTRAPAAAEPEPLPAAAEDPMTATSTPAPVPTAGVVEPGPGTPTASPPAPLPRGRGPSWFSRHILSAVTRALLDAAPPTRGVPGADFEPRAAVAEVAEAGTADPAGSVAATPDLPTGGVGAGPTTAVPTVPEVAPGAQSEAATTSDPATTPAAATVPDVAPTAGATSHEPGVLDRLLDRLDRLFGPQAMPAGGSPSVPIPSRPMESRAQKPPSRKTPTTVADLRPAPVHPSKSAEPSSTEPSGTKPSPADQPTTIAEGVTGWTVHPDRSVTVHAGDRSVTISMSERGNNPRLVRQLGITPDEARETLSAIQDEITQPAPPPGQRLLISFVQQKGDPLAYAMSKLHDREGMFLWNSDAFLAPATEVNRWNARVPGDDMPETLRLSDIAYVFLEDPVQPFTALPSKTAATVTEYSPRANGKRSLLPTRPRAVVRVDPDGVIVEILGIARNVNTGAPAMDQNALVALMQDAGWKVNLTGR